MSTQPCECGFLPSVTVESGAYEVPNYKKIKEILLIGQYNLNFLYECFVNNYSP